MTYRPTFRRQIGDPTTTLDGYICTFTSGAMALDFHTNGKIRVWGGTLARVGGVNARDGGTLPELWQCWKAYGYNLDIRTGQTAADLKAALKAGRAAVIQGDYDQFSLAVRSQDSFTGNHAVLLLPEWNGTKVLMYDPLATGGKWVEWYMIVRYVEKLGRAALGTSYPQKIFFAVTRANTSTTTVPTYPYGARLASRYVEVVARDGLIARSAPNTGARVIKTYPKGARIRTTLFTDKGGSYRVGSQTRDEWYGIKRTDGSYMWIARGFTRLV